MPSWIRATLTLLAAVTLLSGAGFVLARWNEWDGAARILGPLLQYSLYTVLISCAAAAAAGLFFWVRSHLGPPEDPSSDPGEPKERAP